MDELRDRLSELAEAVIEERALTEEFPAVRLSKSQAKSYVLGLSNMLLAETNAAIASVRAARANLINYEDSAMIIPGAQDAKSPLSVAAVSFGLSVGVAVPAVIWLAWPYTSTSIGGFLALLVGAAILATGIGVAACSFWLAKQALDPKSSFGTLGGLMALTLSAAGGAALIIWRWSHLIWPLLLLVLIVAFIVVMILLARVSEQLAREAVSGICRKLLGRAWLLLLMAVLYGIAAGLISSRVAASPDREAAGTAITTILLTPVLLPLLVNAYDRLRGRYSRIPAGRANAHKALLEAVNKAEDEWGEAIRAAIRDSLKQWAGEITQPPFSLQLKIVSSDGLRQMRMQDCVVATQGVFSRFERVLGQIGGGAVGIAGPRGAGKSTLLEAYRDGRFIGAGREHLVVFESVPVRYDPRDFALHLYAALCTKVIEFGEQHAGRRLGIWWQRLSIASRYVPALPVLLTWLAVGSLITALLYGRDSAYHFPAVGAGWLFGMVVATGVVLSMTAGRYRSAQSAQPLISVNNLPALCAVARAKLDGIHFQQRHTTGWSGNMTLPFGFAAGRSGGLERTRQAMSYPELVADFRSFLVATVRVVGVLETAAAVMPVAIIIDELDKVQLPEQAQEFVNEIKALFGIGVPGCIFLVSVSEEALASFERRGLPLRDTFDSAFDSIFRIDPLGLEDTRSILRSRVAGLGEPFVCLCHCFSGGLPREIIRTARHIVGHEKESLSHVCRSLVTEEIKSHVAALRNVISSLYNAEPYSSDLIQHIEEYGRADAGPLLAALHNPPVCGLDIAADESLRTLVQLQLEEFSYLYFCATLLEVFNDQLTEEKLISGYNLSESTCFERLAMARRLFSVNARLAWLTVRSFRRAWHLGDNDPHCPPTNIGQQ